MSEKPREAVEYSATEHRSSLVCGGFRLAGHVVGLLQRVSLSAFVALLVAAVFERIGTRSGVEWLLALSVFTTIAVAGIELFLVGCEVSLVAAVARHLWVCRHELPPRRVRRLWSLFGKGIRLVWWSSSLAVAAICLPWIMMLPLQAPVVGIAFALLVAAFGLQWAATGEYRKAVLSAFEPEPGTPVAAILA